MTCFECNNRLTDEYHVTDGTLHIEDCRYTHRLSHAFLDAAVAAGMKRNDDFNGADQYGAGLYQVTCKLGRRWSVADAYVRPARSEERRVGKEWQCRWDAEE